MTSGPRASASRSAALGAAVLALCPIAAAVAPDDARAAVARTHALVDLEREFGLFVEPALHEWLAASSPLLVAAQLFYVWVHLPATVGALVWAWLERPDGFVVARDTFLGAQLITIAVAFAVPVAPPRLVGGLGFHDTLTLVHGPAAHDLAHSLQAPYAAMPSGHVAFALVAAGTVLVHVRSLALRSLAVAYPAVVVVTILATGNHLWLDAAAAALVTAIAFAAARLRSRRMTVGTSPRIFSTYAESRG